MKDGERLQLTAEEEAAADDREAAYNHPDAVAFRETQAAEKAVIKARGLTLEKIWTVLKDKGLVVDGDLPK